jgi:outer membrane protein TolC
VERVRLVESNVANAQARAADLASTRLIAQGALASDYLQLRIADTLKRLLHETANEHAKSVRITRSQHVVGIASALDFSDAETQLRSTEAQAMAPSNWRSMVACDSATGG